MTTAACEDSTARPIVAASPPMRAVMDQVARIAPARSGVLVCGERGTGRETIARAIHAQAGDPAAPFVKIDCAGKTADAIELQLFGAAYRRAAGIVVERRAIERIVGNCALHRAHGGVLYLENVTDVPARAQARLVRLLRDGEALIDDHPEPAPIDVRPIAAIVPPVEAAVEDGRLRADLFERLAASRIDLPALRERRDDIALLASRLVEEFCDASGAEPKTLTHPALTVLAALPWRGNLPELRTLIERLMLLVSGAVIRLEDVLAHTALEGRISPTALDATLRHARARFERDYIAAVLQHQQGRIADAARVLGIQRTNLYRKMRRLNLTPARTGGALDRER